MNFQNSETTPAEDIQSKKTLPRCHKSQRTSLWSSVTIAPATNISTKKKTSAAGGATLKNRFCHASLEMGPCSGPWEGTMSEDIIRVVAMAWRQDSTCLNSLLLKLDLTRKQVLLDSGGGNLFRKEKEKPKSIPGKKTQSWKVSYTKTRPEIYCNCKCDLYAKKLVVVKRSATPACCTSCIQSSEGQSIQKTLRAWLNFQRELGVFKSVLHRSHLLKKHFLFNV